MIDTNKIKAYVQVDDFNSAYKEIYKEYEQLTKSFLQRHHIELDEKECLPDYCNLIIKYFPKYQSYMKKIKKFMFSEDENAIEKIQKFINSYEEIYGILNS